jgi:hypothetical protein
VLRKGHPSLFAPAETYNKVAAEGVIFVHVSLSVTTYWGIRPLSSITIELLIRYKQVISRKSQKMLHFLDAGPTAQENRAYQSESVTADRSVFEAA